MDDRRYHGLDALRGIMMMMGVVAHAALCYLAHPPPQMPIVDRNTSYVFDLLIHWLHTFRMPTFFVLAGFFTAVLVNQRGLRPALTNRAQRVVGPLLLAAVTILPFSALLLLDFALSVRFGTHELIPNVSHALALRSELQARGVPADAPSPMHLWFLLYLLYFYLLVPGIEFLLKRVERWQQPIRTWLASSWLVPLLGLCTAVTLWPFRGGQVYEGFNLLKPHPPSLMYFGLFFFLGYVFQKYREIFALLATQNRRWACLALGLFPIALYASHLDTHAPTASAKLHLAAVLAHGLCTWSTIYAVLGTALRTFDRKTQWTSYLSQSSYWVYLIHPPFVTFAAWWFVQFNISALAKFMGVVGFAFSVCFLSYHFIIQRSWVSVLLNGRRANMQWPWLPA